MPQTWKVLSQQCNQMGSKLFDLLGVTGPYHHGLAVRMGELKPIDLRSIAPSRN